MNDSSSGTIPLAGQERGASGDALANEDLLPTTAAQRHWDWKDYAALWVGMVVKDSGGVWAGGVGFRYRIARKLGLDAGIDLADGSGGAVFYIQFGHAWTSAMD